MEGDFIGMKMRFRPPNFGCSLLASWPRPTYSMRFKLPNKSYKSSTSSLCSRVQFSYSVAPDAVESNPTCSFTRTDSKNSRTQGQESRAEVPGKTSIHNRSGFVYKTERNVGGVVLDFCSKEELKRYSGMLRECASKGSLNEGKAIHGYLIKSSIEPDAHLWVSLINFYAKCGEQVLARRVLDRMTERDSLSWTVVISGSVSEGNGRDGVSIYREMRDEDIKPDEFALATALKACSLCLDVEFGKQVQAEAIKTGLFYDLVVGSVLVDLYAKCGDVLLAERVLSGMPETNAVSWNALLNGYAQTGDMKEVLRVFCRMTETGIRFNTFILSTALQGCANSGSLQEGKVFHSLLIKSGSEVDGFLGRSLVDMYSKCGSAYDAVEVFKKIKNPDTAAQSAILNFCLKEELKRYSGMLRECASKGSLNEGKAIHGYLIKSSIEPDAHLWASLINFYAKCGEQVLARRVPDRMTERNIVSWTAVISGSVSEGNGRDGVSIYREMRDEDIKPNGFALANALKACSLCLYLEFGKQVQAEAIKTGLFYDLFVGSMIVDLYAKCGDMVLAEKVLSGMPEKIPLSWNALLNGYAQTGGMEEVLRVLCRITETGISFNPYILSTALQGCAKSGSLQEGKVFHSLLIRSGFEVDGFLCRSLVDMYSKCGSASDALKVFNEIKEFRYCGLECNDCCP